MTRASVYRASRIHYYLSPREELRVRKVEFASPGLVSFEGIGETVKELRELFDYVITGAWVKRIIDNYYGIKEQLNLRNVEIEIQRIEARARTSEARAREYESIRRAVEEKSKMKQAIRQFRQQEKISSYESVELGLIKLDELSDHAIALQANGLARLPAVEDSIIRSVSLLNRLGYEQQKIDTPPRSMDG